MYITHYKKKNTQHQCCCVVHITHAGGKSTWAHEKKDICVRAVLYTLHAPEKKTHSHEKKSHRRAMLYILHRRAMWYTLHMHEKKAHIMEAV